MACAGDPCAFGNLFAPDILVEEMVKNVRYRCMDWLQGIDFDERLMFST